MNFHEHKLLRWSLLHRALTAVLLSAVDRMSEEEMQDLIRNPFATFSQTSLRSLTNRLKTERVNVVPIGLLNYSNTSPSYSSTTIEVMIEMVAGKDSSRLSIPLSMLLRATRHSIKECSLTSPRRVIRIVFLLFVLTYLSFQFFISRRLNRPEPKHTSTAADAEVVFCIVASKHLPLPASESAMIKPINTPHPATEDDLEHIPAMTNTNPPQTA